MKILHAVWIVLKSRLVFLGTLLCIEPVINVIMGIVTIGVLLGVSMLFLYGVRILSHFTGWSIDSINTVIASFFAAFVTIPAFIFGVRSALKQDYEDLRKSYQMSRPMADSPAVSSQTPHSSARRSTEAMDFNPSPEYLDLSAEKSFWRWTGLWAFAFVAAIVLCVVMTN